MTSSRTALDDLFSHVVSLIVQNLTGLDLWHRLRPTARDYFRTRLRCERAADQLLSGLDLRYEKAAKTRTGG